jgi:hypothetical protein
MQMRQVAGAAGSSVSGQAQGQGGTGGAGSENAQQQQQQQQPFGPREADALVRRMIEERARDEAHPDNVSNAGSSSTHTALGDDVGMMKKGQAIATAQIAGKKRRI